jgi:hypothetical protein
LKSALKTLAAAVALTLGAVAAQAAGASAPAPAASAAAPVSAAKKELVQKLLKLQEPGVQQLAQQLAEQPALRLMELAGQQLQAVPADKREAVAKAIQADAKKYADEAVPIVRDKAQKLAPSVLGPMLEQNFSEDELRTIINWVESPVSKKYAQLSPQMQQAISEKLVAETRSAIEPKARALQQSMMQQLGIKAPAAASAPAPAKKK